MNIQKCGVRMHVTDALDEGNVDFIRGRAARELGHQIVADLLEHGAAFVEITSAMEPVEEITPGAVLRLDAKLIRGEW